MKDVAVSRIVLEYDDFCDQEPENCIDQLELMVREVPDIKVTMFTIPANRGRTIRDKSWCARVKDLIDNGNLYLGIHGLFHTQQEFESLSEADAHMRLDIALNTLGDRGLNHIPVFKGPHWGISVGTFEALHKLGFTHVYNHEDHRHIADIAQTPLTHVYYNWNLKDEAPEADSIACHGHTHDVCGNGIEETWGKVFSWQYNQKEVEWLPANEY